jgi:hypothetical protein
MKPSVTPDEKRPVTPDEKRSVTVDDHAAWLQSISGPAQTRKAAEVDRLNRILDEIGKEGQD